MGMDLYENWPYALRTQSTVPTPIIIPKCKVCCLNNGSLQFLLAFYMISLEFFSHKCTWNKVIGLGDVTEVSLSRFFFIATRCHKFWKVRSSFPKVEAPISKKAPISIVQSHLYLQTLKISSHGDVYTCKVLTTFCVHLRAKSYFNMFQEWKIWQQNWTFDFEDEYIHRNQKSNSVVSVIFPNSRANIGVSYDPCIKASQFNYTFLFDQYQ